MFLDANLQLSSAQAITTSSVSTNAIDLSLARETASGEYLGAIFTVDTSAAAAGAATVTFQIVSSASANLSSPTILAQTDAIPKADLTAGRRPFAIGLASHVLAAQQLGQRYLGVQYVVGSGPLTAGAFSAWMTNSQADAAMYHPTRLGVA